MSWCSWSRLNPCPVCGGHGWAGKSAEQCRGGFNDKSPQVVYCSVKPSSVPREKTWLWVLDEPYDYVPEISDGDPMPIWERTPSRRPRDLRDARWVATAEWEYRDEHGNYAYSVVRFDWNSTEDPPEGMRRKDYRPGRRFERMSALFRWGLPEELRVPYHLPDVLAAREAGWMVWIVEGEKSADMLREKCGEIATTMPGGSNSFLRGDPKRWFDGGRYAVVVDRDEAGLSWARDVRGVCPSANFWQSATLGEGDDVVDHLEAGHDLSELIPLEVE